MIVSSVITLAGKETPSEMDSKPDALTVPDGSYVNALNALVRLIRLFVNPKPSTRSSASLLKRAGTRDLFKALLDNQSR